MGVPYKAGDLSDRVFKNTVEAGEDKLHHMCEQSGTWTVSISGSVTVTGSVSISGSVAVTGPLTDAQLRATAVPVSGPLTDAQLRATAVPVSGTFWQATQPVSLATLPALVAGTAVIGKVSIDQTTPGTTNLVQVGGSLPAGTNNIGDVDVLSLPALPAGTNNIGDVDVLSLPALPAGSNIIGSVRSETSTSGGESSHSTFQTSAAVIAAEIKGSAGQVYSLEYFNDDTVPVYVRLYDMTGAPGTGDGANIKRRFKVPAGTGLVKSWSKGLVFSTGIGIRVTKAVADNDGTALAANTVYGNVGYK